MTDTDELAGRAEATVKAYCLLHSIEFSGDSLRQLIGFLAELTAALRALRAERDEARAEAHDAKVEMLKEWDRYLGTKLDLAKQAQENAVLREAMVDLMETLFSGDPKARKDGSTSYTRARSLAQGETT